MDGGGVVVGNRRKRSHVVRRCLGEGPTAKVIYLRENAFEGKVRLRS